MTCLTRISRLATAAALSGALACPPPPALAQDAPTASAPDAPPAASPAAPPTAPQEVEPAAGTGDPPARAGRIARLAGVVSFHGPGADHWDPATLNFPLTSGDALWTEPEARATVEVSSNRVTLAGGTELDIDTLDAQALSATAAQGEIYLRIRRLAPGESYTIRTPRGTVTLAAPGRYDIAAGDTTAATTVTVEDGAAQVTATGVTLAVQAGQTATVTGADTFQGVVGGATRDAFLTAMLAEERPVAAGPAPQVAAAAAPSASVVAVPPPIVTAMPGADDLDAYGAWQPSAGYGTVWYPQVAADWVPYRHGRWAFVAPWGWTWIDEAPWGFAPFHYGRWVQIDSRWAWSPGYVGVGYVAPGPYVEPVYAPALVSFFGFGVGVGVGIGVGIGLGASVGWCPLGFGEPYHPWYGGSPGYLNRINRSYVASTTNISTVTNITYANRGVTTVVPGGTMTASRPVAASALALTPQQLAAAHPSPIPAVRPTAATAGVTAAVAQRLNLPTAPADAAHAAAPGPGIAPAAAHAAAPALRTPIAHATTTAVRTGAPGPAIQPAAAAATLHTPPLRAPAAAAATAPHLAAAPHGAVPHGAAPGPAIMPRAAAGASLATHAPAAVHATPAVPQSQLARQPHAVTQSVSPPRAIPRAQPHIAAQPYARSQPHVTPQAQPQRSESAPRPAPRAAPRSCAGGHSVC